jgi:ABC-2 type transport system ATP-binding protein
MIELSSVTKLYGTVIGVNDVTLTLGPGAHGLLGPNGSGKTTFLNLITGQLRPTRGDVTVFGQCPWNNAELFRRIGIGPGFEGLYSEISGFDWVVYLMQLHGFGKYDARTRAETALDICGMKDSMHRKMGAYSRGMRQRTKLAQAIAHEPEFLILDEPFNGLDPVGRYDIAEVLHGWIRRGGSLIVASHILHEVESLATSFLLICGGRLLASGTPEEVHSLLTDLPNEFKFTGIGLTALARHLLEENLVDSLRFETEGRLSVTTRNALAMVRQIPQWCDGEAVRVTEMTSGDDSLQDLFTTLMRIHRGELR